MSHEEDPARLIDRAAAIAVVIAAVIFLALGIRGAAVGDVSQTMVGVVGVVLSVYVGRRRYLASRRPD